VGDDFVRTLESLFTSSEATMLAILVVFAIVHSGLAYLRPYGEAPGHPGTVSCKSRIPGCGAHSYSFVTSAAPSKLVLPASTCYYSISETLASMGTCRAPHIECNAVLLVCNAQKNPGIYRLLPPLLPCFYGFHACGGRLASLALHCQSSPSQAAVGALPWPPTGEELIGARAYRVVFALASLPLALAAVVYFINHRYDGVQFWNLRCAPTLEPSQICLVVKSVL
jgi:hypothetical protein